MDFVVLDFETGTNDRYNPIEIGLAFVENRRIIATKSWLIKPHRFDPSFKRFHGMVPKDVSNSPEFPVVWKEVYPLIEGKFVFAHNAPVFDMLVLRKTLEYYGLAFPNITYGCTIQIAKIVFPRRKSHSLESLCETLKIKYLPHRAEEDARATAELALIMFEEHGIFSFKDISERFYIRFGQFLAPNHHIPLQRLSKRERERQQEAEERRKTEERQRREAEERERQAEEQRRRQQREERERWERQQREAQERWERQQEEEREKKEKREKEFQEAVQKFNDSCLPFLLLGGAIVFAIILGLILSR